MSDDAKATITIIAAIVISASISGRLSYGCGWEAGWKAQRELRQSDAEQFKREAVRLKKAEWTSDASGNPVWRWKP